MNNPAARSPLISGPMPTVRVEAFEGPLDLLLHLIRINKADIFDIPIAEITGQYLAALDNMETPDLANAGEYLVLAATLIEIKSRLLLPQAPPSEEESEDPRTELVQRLLEYRQFKDAVETMQQWEGLRRQVYFRGAVQNADDYLLPLPEGEASSSLLFQALHRLLSEAGIEDRAISAVTPRKKLSLRLKMAELIRRLEAARPAPVAFETLFSLPCPLYDIVLVFLALLELLKAGRATIEQEKLFGAVLIYAAAPLEETV